MSQLFKKLMAREKELLMVGWFWCALIESAGRTLQRCCQVLEESKRILLRPCLSSCRVQMHKSG